MRVRIGVIEMGRKSECWVGMAILGTGVMLASFHCCATVDVASDMSPVCTESHFHYTTFSSKITVSSWVTGWIQGDKSNNTATV